MATLTAVAMTVFALSLPAEEAAVKNSGGANADATEFFEKHIRPVLAAECYECHGEKKAKGGLRVHTREALLKGGDTGPAVVPGAPNKSLLIRAISHKDPDLEMPKDRPRLDEKTMQAFVRWVKDGVPFPDAEVAATVTAESWESTFARRKQWWSLQPVHKPVLPSVKNRGWSSHPVDQFILARLEGAGLQPASSAEKRVLLRRITFALTGLPPTVEETDGFLADRSADAYSKVVDRLLASPRFGEHWARHWMDLIRYAESHGSEGDPVVPWAWRFRDYLIRAFNADVPYDQFIREQIAGDLLPKPRYNPQERLNESMLGIAHYRMVEHGYQPVDELDEQVKFVDNQIDVLGKTFQALTISCARCHDHKFDAISQKDFYALYGIFASSRPAQVTIDVPEQLALLKPELTRLKQQIKSSIADVWLNATNQFTAKLADLLRIPPKSTPTSTNAPPPEPWETAWADAATNTANPLHILARAGSLSSADLRSEWARQTAYWQNELRERKAFNAWHFTNAWVLSGDDYEQWFKHGSGLPESPSAAGEFSLEPSGDQIVSGIYPAGVFTHLLARRHHGVLTSPRLKIETSYISVRALGDKDSSMRLLVENYPLSGGRFPSVRPKKNGMTWLRMDTAYWKGSHAYFEAATAEDLTTYSKSAEDGDVKPSGSYFGIDRIVIHDGKESPKEEVIPILPLLAGDAPTSAEELISRYAASLTEIISSWRRGGSLTDDQTAYFDFFVRHGFLPNNLSKLSSLQPLVKQYRKLEAEVPGPRRAPGLLEGCGFDQAFFPRGDHNRPGEPVPRHYLTALGSQPYRTALSGRLELADEIASANNPLTARVMVNRIWYHLFGRGVVASVDNFGRMGSNPTHPELLDYLAVRFVEHGWSVKDMIRFLVTSRTFQMSSQPSSAAFQKDPANELWQHMRLRRLEAEAIRDSLLAASGQLDSKMYGASVSQPPMDNNRRSVYISIRRGRPHPFLEVFDAPIPATTRGQRDLTNLPAQSLALMNDPFVITLAGKWAESLVANASMTAEQRIQRVFTTALGRPASRAEVKRAKTFLANVAAENHIAADQMSSNVKTWQDLAQAILSLKEFIYVQ